jgi:hypothetical protein
LGHRARGAASRADRSHLPPEDWHEPNGDFPAGYRIRVYPPGAGYIHVVTPEEIRDRLAQLPQHMVDSLEVVQLSRMTRKKKTFPCYGIQWGSAIYLYPLEATLVEEFAKPPRPAEYIEARMYGGRWVQEGEAWKLVWTRDSIRDFYLNNVLLHELGHVIDSRNAKSRDRERFAEWFAIEYGYRPSRRGSMLKPRQ